METENKKILMLPNITKHITTAQYRRICDSFLTYGFVLYTVAESADFAGVTLPVLPEERWKNFRKANSEKLHNLL